MKKWLCWLILICMTLSLLPAAAEEEYRTLKVGLEGEDVLRMKQRLAELGYMRGDHLSRQYTSEIASIVKRFQECNGLEKTGKMDADAQKLLFSDRALVYHKVTPSPVPTPEPTPEPTPAPTLSYPERDGEGYLLGDGEYIFESPETGIWVYLSKDLQVDVRFYEDPSIPLQWFEADIRCRGDVRLETAETNPNRPGTRFSRPSDIAKEHGYVLGFTDDFYGYRISQNQSAGFVIREGVVKSKHSIYKRTRSMPNLDLLVQFSDGTLKAYPCGSITMDELLAMDVVNTYTFGPLLLSGGEIEPLIVDNYINKYPRQALGMVEPGHYVVLSVKGRIKASEGCAPLWMAQRMQEMGVQEAINLDGGNTCGLVFCGDLLTRTDSASKKNVRAVTSLIGIGHTEHQKEGY